MDLITNLPDSHGHDAILTIVDHGCTRATVFLPCKTTITGEGIATLYHENVYRWFGLPAKVISDRDPRFTSHFAKALCQCLGIEQNISTTFHPQTDGISERKNQWVELFLRHLTSDQQDDWSEWLTVATAVHNHYENATTKIAPIEAFAGIPTKVGLLRPAINERTCRREDHHRPSETSPSKRSDQSMGRETAGSETSHWRQSLVRRQESETPLSEPETGPETLRTIQDQLSHLPSGVSARPSPIMDNT